MKPSTTASRRARAARLAARREFLARLAEVLSPSPDADDEAPTAGVPTETRQLVYARARLRCERDNIDLAAGGGHIHHRRPRKRGGSTVLDVHSPANLLLLCYSCHDWVEKHRTISYDQGFLVRATADPVTVPVLVRGEKVLLHPTDPIHIRV